jgi:hypothetical protein
MQGKTLQASRLENLHLPIVGKEIEPDVSKDSELAEGRPEAPGSPRPARLAAVTGRLSAAP